LVTVSEPPGWDRKPWIDESLGMCTYGQLKAILYRLSFCSKQSYIDFKAWEGLFYIWVKSRAFVWN
jgi:hypothetical protein